MKLFCVLFCSVIFSSLCLAAIGADGGSENFDASGNLPSGWVDVGTENNTDSAHYKSASNCRAIAQNELITTPAIDFPKSISFYVDSSSGGDGDTATLEYSIDNGAWQSLASFVVSQEGNIESYDLTSAPNLAKESSVKFRFNSDFYTWYLDDVMVTVGVGYSGPSIENIQFSPTAPHEFDLVQVSASIVGLSNVVGQEIVFDVDGGSKLMEPMVSNGSNLFVASISSNSVASTVSFFVRAWDAQFTNQSAEFAYTVRDSQQPFINLLVHDSTPTSDQAVQVSCAVSPNTLEGYTVIFKYTANNWSTFTSLNATNMAGSVYVSMPIPSHSVNTIIEYTAVAQNHNGTIGLGPTNSFKVLGAGSGGANYLCRIMAANISNGNAQKYDDTGIRIFKGMNPDIVAIQEFNYTDLSGGGARQLVDDAFGPEFYYCDGAGSIPNGVISRWPIKAWGEWPSDVSNRDYTWATIDIPGPIDLHVVSVHLPTSSSGDRNDKANDVKIKVLQNFPTTDYVIVGGDMNTGARSEAAIDTFESFLSDGHIPVDQNSNDKTNNNRNKPYDYVLPNFTLNAKHVATVIEGTTFNNGIVYDSRISAPVFRPGTIQANDSTEHQHMGIVKDFLLDGDGAVDNPPILAAIANVSVEPNIPIIFSVSATDVDNDTLTLTSSDLIHFSPVSNQGSVSSTFSWTPNLDDGGDYSIEFLVEAGDKSAGQIINIAVLPEPTSIIALIFFFILKLIRN